MLANNPSIEKKNFSAKAVNDQLQKILSDPVFAVSDILKRFLSFIVKETLEGRSNQLKEYTIAVGVLHKPADFKPQHDAIVRIHAGRLRRALNYYYDTCQQIESIHISIPKGGYVPIFEEPGRTTNDANKSFAVAKPGPFHPRIVGVMPFTYFEKAPLKISFAEGLAVQLSTELAHIKNISVIAYYTMRTLAEKISDMREIITAVGAQYIFTGNIQYQKNYFRINVQLIDADTSAQVWSKMFERQLSKVNMFDIEDDIIRQIISAFEIHNRLDKEILPKPLLMAIG